MEVEKAQAAKREERCESLRNSNCAPWFFAHDFALARYGTEIEGPRKAALASAAAAPVKRTYTKRAPRVLTEEQLKEKADRQKREEVIKRDQVCPPQLNYVSWPVDVHFHGFPGEIGG